MATEVFFSFLQKFLEGSQDSVGCCGCWSKASCSFTPSYPSTLWIFYLFEENVGSSIYWEAASPCHSHWHSKVTWGAPFLGGVPVVLCPPLKFTKGPSWGADGSDVSRQFDLSLCCVTLTMKHEMNLLNDTHLDKNYLEISIRLIHWRAWPA